MGPIFIRQSATLYDFPTRFAMARLGGEAAKPASNVVRLVTAQPAYRKADFGSCWYHDDAIRQGHPPRKQ